MIGQKIPGKMIRSLIGMVLCFAIMPISARSQDQRSGASGNRNQNLLENTDDHGNTWNHDPIVFSRRDLRVIHDYYRARWTLPSQAGEHGGSLPPSQRKQLKRNRTLSGALEKSLQGLPEELERFLTPLNPAYRRLIIGKDMLIVEIHSQRITDIIHLVLNKP